MKSFVKPILLLLLIFNFSCDKEENDIIPETIEQAAPESTVTSNKITSITLNDLQREIGQTSNYHELADRFDVTATSKKGSSKNDDFIVDTKHINKIEANGQVSYTLRIESDKEIQNVVIEPQKDSLEIKLYTYDMFDEVELDDEYITLGNVQVSSLNKDDISDLSTQRNYCYTVTIGFPYPCEGTLGNGEPANHYPGDSCSANEQPGYLWFTTEVCTPDGGGGGFPLKLPRECSALQCSSPIETWGGGGGSGGGPSGGGGLGDSSIPILDNQGNSLWEVYLQGSIALLDSRLNLSFLDENWLKYNTTKMQEIIDFLHFEDWSTEAKAFGKEAITIHRTGTSQQKGYVNSALDASTNAITFFPLVKYPEDKAAQYKRDYPKLTEYLENELPKIANDEKIINSIHGITDAPKEVIREALKWGKGPEIEIKQLGGEGDNELYGSYRGHIDATKINTLFLDVDLANDLENLENSQDFRDAIAFLIAVTLLHEYNHLGDFVFGDHFWGELHMENRDDENEAGIIFEKEVFGESVWRSNAGLILRNYKLD